MPLRNHLFLRFLMKMWLEAAADSPALFYQGVFAATCCLKLELTFYYSRSCPTKKTHTHTIRTNAIDNIYIRLYMIRIQTYTLQTLYKSTSDLRPETKPLHASYVANVIMTDLVQWTQHIVNRHMENEFKRKIKHLPSHIMTQKQENSDELEATTSK